MFWNLHGTSAHERNRPKERSILVELGDVKHLLFLAVAAHDDARRGFQANQIALWQTQDLGGQKLLFVASRANASMAGTGKEVE
jgi:hypothetical protein